MLFRSRANLKFLADWVQFAPDVSPEDQLLLSDAQTSGGLLAAVPQSQVEEIVRGLKSAGTLVAAVVGRIGAVGTGKITVTRIASPPVG